MDKIGIIGCGFVGGAVAQGFALQADVKIYDKIKPGFDSLEETCQQEFLFLCVPTPVRKNGSQNLGALIDVLGEMAAFVPREEKRIVLIKSTVLPGTNRSLSKMFNNFDFIANPEFLTARAARLDFINSARIVIGGNPKDWAPARRVERMYKDRFPSTPIFTASWETAELVKYMANNFFALKISYLNEMYDIARSLGVDYEVLKAMWLADGRIGNSHHQVPGHDGDRGYGGTCFPKDIKSFVEWGKRHTLPVRTLEAAIEVNNRVRRNIDWVETE